MRKKPTFIWQGILILLPLALLLAFGIYSLRQDRKLVDVDAKDRCLRTAQDLAHRLENASLFQSSPRLHESLVIDSEGRLVSIAGSTNRARFVDLHPADLDLRKLSADQSTTWNEARSAEFTRHPQAAVEAYKRFLQTKPPESFVPLAQYSLALEIVMTGAVFTESEAILRQLETNAEATTEAGLPLHLLASLRRLSFAYTKSFDTGNLEPFTNLLTLVCSNAVNQPSAASPMVLSEATELERQLLAHNTSITIYPVIASRWRDEWQRDQAMREAYTTIRPELHQNTTAFWANAEEGQDEPSLVTVTPTADNAVNLLSSPQIKPFYQSPFLHQVPSTNYVVRWLSRSQLRMTIVEIEKGNGVTVPDFADVTYEVAGMPLNDSPAKEPLNVVKLNSSMETGSIPVEISVRVVKPDLLYAHQRQRMFWFAGLIAVSGLAACIGLISAHRGFRQQLRLNEMKSNFVSSVSHELRAPIASVRLLAEALDRGAVSEPPKQKEYFRFIVQECRRLTGLIENVLDFSRIEQGRKQYYFEETDLTALVDQTVKLMQPTATERGVSLERSKFDVQCSMFNVVCDGLAIQQALLNLIDNAIKHSPSGEKVLVELGSSSSSNTIYLSVTDHGPGIPSEEHQKIFERFYRRGSELRRETQGIGIGLSIVKHVAEAHGGRVLVESAVGRGSKFTIVLPAPSQAPEKHEARNPKSETNPNI